MFLSNHITAIMRRILFVEQEIERERSFRYQDALKIVALKKARLRLKDRLKKAVSLEQRKLNRMAKHRSRRVAIGQRALRTQ